MRHARRDLQARSPCPVSNNSSLTEERCGRDGEGNGSSNRIRRLQTAGRDRAFPSPLVSQFILGRFEAGGRTTG